MRKAIYLLLLMLAGARLAGAGSVEEILEKGGQQHAQMLGMQVQALSADVAQQLGYEPGIGVLVVQVVRRSSAARKGIRPGDVILQLNRRPVTTVEEYAAVLSKVEAGEAVMLLVLRGRYASHVALRMPK